MALPTATIHWTFQPADISAPTMVDQGSAGVDGTLVGAPTLDQATFDSVRRGVLFDGTSQLCEVAFASIPAPATSFSAAGFCRVDSSSAGRIIWSMGASNPTAYRGVWVERDTDLKLHFVVQGGSAPTERNVATVASIPNGVWFAWTVSWDGTNMRIRIRTETLNELREATPGSDPVVYDAAGFFRFASRYDPTTSRYFHGVLGDGRWWNNVILTEAEEREYVNLYMSRPFVVSEEPEGLSFVLAGFSPPAQTLPFTVYESERDRAEAQILRNLEEGA